MLQNVIHMKGILTTLILVCALGLSAQTPSDHLIKAADYRLASLCFTAGGGALYLIADNQVKYADPGTINNYKILRAFSAGCVGFGLACEVLSITQLRKAGLTIKPTGTGLNLSYRF